MTFLTNFSNNLKRLGFERKRGTVSMSTSNNMQLPIWVKYELTTDSETI